MSYVHLILPDLPTIGVGLQIQIKHPEIVRRELQNLTPPYLYPIQNFREQHHLHIIILACFTILIWPRETDFAIGRMFGAYLYL